MMLVGILESDLANLVSCDRFNEPGKEWEDKWGLLDINRNLKTGITIPDCGGQTVDGKTWM